MTDIGARGVIHESIAPGISRLVVPTDTLPPATSTNAWLLGREALTVVDPGASDPAVQEAVVKALSTFTVARIVLTHHHPDHTSGAQHLSQATGAPIAGHPDTRGFFPGLDTTLEDGDTLTVGTEQWQVLHTPGHAHGHICLLRQTDGYAVVGDLLAGEGTILIAPPEGHLATYLHSLRRLQRRQVVHALPAHGPVLDAQSALEMYLTHRHARTAQVNACLAGGLATPLAMAAQIYPHLPAPFRPVAAHQLRAHLTWLIEHQTAYRMPDAADHFGPL